MGVCDGGLANGAGVGIIKNADGTAFEYYGNAENGLAQGAGYMIVHGAENSYALEGNFTAGQADGTMRVSKAGQKDQLRRFVAGQDSGRSNSSEGVNSPFNRAKVGA